jgi:hypothetical protein
VLEEVIRIYLDEAPRHLSVCTRRPRSKMPPSSLASRTPSVGQPERRRRSLGDLCRELSAKARPARSPMPPD